MSALRTQVRTLSQASRRAPARSSAARFQRRCVTDDSSPPAGKGPAKGQGAGAPPIAGLVAMVSIPAIAWFFFSRAPSAAGKGAVMKDARRETPPEEEAAKRPGITNEDTSKSVPKEKPADKETKPANPKAVSPDNQRLDTESDIIFLPRDPTARPVMEHCLSWLASLVDPESNRRYVDTWAPHALRRVSLFCPWVVYGRIENRIRDLERGGDGFGIPYCCCNERCFCGCFQFCCCCGCCCGYSEILVLQRDMARIWGHPRPENEMDEYVARRRPWRFLEDTEAGLHAACAARNRRRHPLDLALQNPRRTDGSVAAARWHCALAVPDRDLGNGRRREREDEDGRACAGEVRVAELDKQLGSTKRRP
ncbi:hypothetical protein VUR80DRAFT_9665 [Thermomyces stellatus]